MILVVPAATAVTTPEPFTVATEVLELVHAPPPSPLLEYCAVAAIQSGEDPLTVPAFAFGLTVNVLSALTGEAQPLLIVYVILVVPAATALTTPEAFTVAIEVLELVHDPPPSPLLV